MSYDLLLLSEQGATMRYQVYDFFAARPNYTATDDDIIYENPETGVHFQWIFVPYHLDELNEESEQIHPHEIGHLRLNFFRPTAFAKEAAIELLALAQALPVQFYDLPQGLIYDTFAKSEQLTAPYAEHAQKAVSALMASNQELPTIEREPTRALDAIWEWNFNREALTESLGEDLFVPKIDFFQFDDQLKTGVVWGDAVPMLCPYVDIVVLYRVETAPVTGWFRRKGPKVDVLTFEEFKETFSDWFSPDTRAPNAVSCSPFDADGLFSTAVSNPLTRDIPQAGHKGKHSLEMLDFSAVLDTEICVPISFGDVTVMSKPIEGHSDEK